MHDTVYNEMKAVNDGTFKGANVTLTAADDATGFVSAADRCQLTDETITRIKEAQTKVKAGEIVPAANFNGITPDTFTW
jgi:basic membrane protein A